MRSGEHQHIAAGERAIGNIQTPDLRSITPVSTEVDRARTRGVSRAAKFLVRSAKGSRR